MKKIILFAFIAIALLTISASAQSDVRVKFAKGNTEKTLSGAVQGRGFIDYIFKVNEYEFIGVTLKSVSKSVKFTIRNPKDVVMKKGNSVRVFNGEATESGEFRVRVFFDGNSDRVMKYKLTISAFQGT
jgi:hypothetical protein